MKLPVCPVCKKDSLVKYGLRVECLSCGYWIWFKYLKGVISIF